jgi:hypothetical protein
VLGDDRDRPAGYLHMGIANATLRGLRLDETLTASTRAEEIATDLDDLVLAANAMLLRGIARFERGSPDEGGRLVEEAHAISEAHANPFLVLLTCWNRGYLHLALDDPMAADAWFSREMSTSRFDDAPLATSVLSTNHCRCLFELGHLNELDPRWRGRWSPAIADRLGADPPAALEEIQRVLDELRTGGDRWTLLWHLHLAGAVLRMLGLPQDGRVLLDEALAIANEAQAIVQLVPIRCELALLEPAGGRDHVTGAQQIIDGGGFGNLPARVALADAVDTAAEGDVATAELRFSDAIASMRAGGRVWMEADAFAQWGHALAAIGDSEAARAQRAAAAKVYRRIDAAPHWIERLTNSTQ